MHAFESRQRESGEWSRAGGLAEKNLAPAPESRAYSPELFIRRKAACSCGGGCPSCRGNDSGLRISHPNDSVEIEADRIADRVMGMRDGDAGRRQPGLSGHHQTEGGNGRTLNRKSGNPGGGIDAGRASATHVGKAINSPGVPLSASDRNFFEPRLGYDLSDVRIHTGRTAAESANSVFARAYTLGNHVVFGAGEYQPGTESGKRLLAHELAHVGQQRAGDRHIQREGMGDLRMSEAYNETVASIKSSLKYQNLGVEDKKTVDAIIDEIGKKPDWPAKSYFINQFQLIFKRDPSKAHLKTARAAILTLSVDQAKMTALLDALTKPLGKPLLGYTASGFDFEERFFRHSGKLGLDIENPALDSYKAGPYDRNQPASITDPADASFRRSDIIFFSGHQYAQYKEPGTFTNEQSNSCFNIGMLSKDNKRVKLVVSTGCATICKDVAKIWQAKFPDALILGYRFSAPKRGDIVADAFAKALVKKGAVDLDDAASLDKVRDAWKSVVLGKGSISGGPGLLYNGEVEIYSGGKWIKKPWDDKANDCHYHHP